MRFQILFFLLPMIIAADLGAQGTGPTPEPTLSHDTSAIRKVGPPLHLIKEWPATTTSSQPREGIIPGTRVVQNLKTDQVKIIFPIEPIPVPAATTPREAAEKFLIMHHDKLGLLEDLSNIEFDRELTTDIIDTFRYFQLFGGLPVKFGQLGVSVQSDLSVVGASFALIPISTPPPAKPFNPTNSEQAMKVALKTINAHWIPNANPVAKAEVLVEDGEPRVVWSVTFTFGEKGIRKLLESLPEHLRLSYFEMVGWEVLVDANTLQPVAALDRSR